MTNTMATATATARRNTILQGTFIHSKTKQELEILHNAAVAVDDQGKIAAIEKGHEDGIVAKQQLLNQLGWSEDQVDVLVSKDAQFFFPGFIDSHIHAPQYANSGLFGKTTLLDWLQTYTFPMEASLKDLDRARKVYNAAVRRTLAFGTTTASYYASLDVAATNLLADLCLKHGQRAFVGRVCMDRPGINPDYYRDESVQEAMDATRATIEHIRKIDPSFDIVAPIITPRFAPSCTPESMKLLSELQMKEGLIAQTHISENVPELGLVKELYPDSKSYADVYDKYGLLNDKMILGHAVHLTLEEMDLISQRKSKIAHCPCSNNAIGSGSAPVRCMWDKGIQIGLGTDVGAGYSSSILEVARQAMLVSRHPCQDREDQDGEKAKLTIEEVLYLGTRGGAECVGLQDKIGGFEVGKEWDAQLIGLGGVPDPESYDASLEPSSVDIFGWESWEEMLAKWLYTGDDRNVKKVWVKGRLVHSRK